MNCRTLAKAWALLDAKERRHGCLVMIIAMVAAVFSAAMVGSIIPFLSVLTNPNKIHEIELFRTAYEQFGFSSEYRFLVILGALSLIAIIVANLFQILRTWAVTRFSLMRIHTISYRLLENYLSQHYEYFLNHHTDAMSTQILAESQEVVYNFFRPLTEVLASLLTVICMLGLLIWVNPVVSLIVFCVLGTLYAAIVLLSRRIISRSGVTRVDQNKIRYRIVGEALGALKEIKLLGRERHYISHYCGASIQVAQSFARMSVIGEIPRYIIQIVGFGGIILLCLLLTEPSSFQPGNAPSELFVLLGVYAFAGQRLLPEFSMLYLGFVKLNYASPIIDTVYTDLIATMPQDASPLIAPEPLGLKQELRLEQVSYRYPNAPENSLHEVSFTVKAGEKIGIVGSTGAGKTTLADIILGLYAPSSGRIIVDGTAVTTPQMRAWRRTLGYVPQSIFLIDASVSENIALGLPRDQIDPNRLHEVAQIARIDGFIQSLPQGYDTPIGEHGVRLSGGQRQRIGIARALYERTDLIVFDEATSALDNVTEQDVMSALENLPENKTILIIAHRLSTVKKCDRIVVMQGGRVTGFDSWDVLSQQHAFFQHLASLDGQEII